jgi:hypothetical protein
MTSLQVNVKAVTRALSSQMGNVLNDCFIYFALFALLFLTSGMDNVPNDCFIYFAFFTFF